jgi:hypothetical protein
MAYVDATYITDDFDYGHLLLFLKVRIHLQFGSESTYPLWLLHV